MVIESFPLFKLGALAMRQISRPVADVIKTKALEYPVFRKYVCMPPAQIYNWAEVKTKMWVLKMGKPVHVPRLTESMAVKVGSNLLGEFVIFSIGASVVMLEYKRQSRKEALKMEQASLEKAALINNIAGLELRLDQHDAKLQEIAKSMVDEVETPTQQPEEPTKTPPTPDTRQKSIYNKDGGAAMRALYFLDTEVFGNAAPHQPPSNTSDKK